ncbi:putative tripeptidyl-peptidase II [Rosa chinensis]|uniref:Putative tripeptidyl-peptidase II n=1 Tax=Rosa chinensis TaxID=74649 RepID=A0A2P6RNM7_ROSCH|nr:subtilisin-like protease SBT1.9 [Rosa chinensis]PRQ48004.1 putative tripeptidyl-peptidase II [Rosa chinensis]
MATLAVLVLCSILISIMASAQSHTYIVHMDSSAMPKAFFDHHKWYLATLSSLSDGVNAEATTSTTTKLIYTYTNAIQGFSATLTLSELESLKSSLGFISYIRDRPLKLLTTRSSRFLGLTPLFGAWPASNYGENVTIGVIDTGVWPESESFNDEGMTQIPSRWKGKCESGTQFSSSLCNKKLIGARFYYKGFIAENPDLNISMKSARDTNGHGTHTSSIAAGNYVKGASYFGYATGTAVGVAPRARIAMYKVGWYGEISGSDVIAAVDQSIQDGVDILSLSLGYSLDEYLYHDIIAIATFAAMNKGIFVAVAAGNDGPGYGTLVNGAPWAVIVGAGTIDRQLGGILTLGNGMKITFPSLYPRNFSRDTQLPLVFNGCQSVMELKKLKGKIVVCKDNMSIDVQVENAKSAKVSGVVFISNATLSDYDTINIFPAAVIGDQDGKLVVDYIKQSSNPKAILEFRKTVIGTKPAPRVDDYSSRGPFPSCPTILKPDILAPGSLILASWSPTSSVSEDQSSPLFSNFNLDTGTSMSAPHVAGVAALIKSVHPDWSPAAIRSALMTTANPLDNTHSPIKDTYGNLIASPLAIGAGHINPNKALDPGLVYDAAADDYIKLLCAMKFTAKQIQIITGSIYKCANRFNIDINYPSFIAYFNSNGSNSDAKVVQEFKRTLTNVGEEQSSYIVNLTALAGLKLKVEPQRLVFTKKYEKLRYKLTMVGPKLLKEDLVQGSLSWIDDGGKYVVRSPIVATNIVPDSLIRD